ncbi:hypothetical protein L916_14847 [Phytophthora nicotianae]|uniref:Uncharacterized protein n=1 Tax=Phytophthora nicotianae TaxID=4792 RepID=W2IEZ6_PHYNI|nr:hypothetical protein L916_14847 [Phytophthora nicotianae]
MQCWSTFLVPISLGAYSIDNRHSVAMVDLRIPEDQIKDALSSGKLDTLTRIPVDEIRKKVGIRYVRSCIDESRAKGMWNDFWRYFVKTWMERYDATKWNVQEMVRYEVDIINRTNNPLEKNNRDFASRLGTHPSLLAFIEGTKKEAERYIRLIIDIKHGRQSVPHHTPPVQPVVPASYACFV